MPSAVLYNSLRANPAVKGSTYLDRGYQPINRPNPHYHITSTVSYLYPAILGRHLTHSGPDQKRNVISAGKKVWDAPADGSTLFKAGSPLTSLGSPGLSISISLRLLLRLLEWSLSPCGARRSRDRLIVRTDTHRVVLGRAPRSSGKIFWIGQGSGHGPPIFSSTQFWPPPKCGSAFLISRDVGYDLSKRSSWSVSNLVFQR